MSRVGTFEIMKNSLLSIAEEMKVVLAKTAYSPLLKLAGDYSCGLFDIHGDMVAQGPDIPIHLGSACSCSSCSFCLYFPKARGCLYPQ